MLFHRTSPPRAGRTRRRPVSRGTGTTAVGVLMIVVASATVVSSCVPITTPEEPPAIQVGALTLSRWEADPQRYRLSLSVYNGTSRTLTGFVLEATATAPATTAPAADALSVTVDGAPPRRDYVASQTEGTPETPTPYIETVKIDATCSVAPHASPVLEAVFRSPFPFVPPDPLELTEIVLRSFRFADGTTPKGTLSYPYLVREEL